MNSHDKALAVLSLPSATWWAHSLSEGRLHGRPSRILVTILTELLRQDYPLRLTENADNMERMIRDTVAVHSRELQLFLSRAGRYRAPGG
jgi:hypothetical protein